MTSDIEKLKGLLGEAQDVSCASAVLSWDQETYMPSGGAEGRASQISTLSSIAHKKLTSKSIGRLLDKLEPQVASLPPNSFEARLLKRVRRDYERKLKVPARLVQETSKACSLGQVAWAKAREASAFQLFRPHLEKIVELKRKYAELFAPYDDVYDPLLEDFEPGMKASEVAAIFSKLRLELLSLVKSVAGSPRPDESFLAGDFDAQRQLDFTVEVMTKLGFDWSRGRQDKSAHPFTTSFGSGDVRVTTRVVKGAPLSSLFSSVHECGHALYEQGFGLSLARTPLADGASLGVHESQSRLWENMVARSREFWTFFLPRFKELFPKELSGVGIDAFLKAVNKVEPSLIRVESDETTYNLHIMLRFELERRLMDGSLTVKELPAAWNAGMLDYLGVEPSCDAEGVLQDVHWSMGAIGYFPTYSLGNLMSAQLWEAANAEIPSLKDEISRGRFEPLLSWLRAKVHVHGAMFEPQETMLRATGAKLGCEAFLRHLKAKLSASYGV